MCVYIWWNLPNFLGLELKSKVTIFEMFLLSLIPPSVFLAHNLEMWCGGKQGAGRTERGFWWFPSPGVLKKYYPFFSRFALAVFWLSFLEIDALVLSHHKNTCSSEDSVLWNIFLFQSIYHTDLFSSLSRSVIKIQCESSPFLEKGHQVIFFFSYTFCHLLLQ